MHSPLSGNRFQLVSNNYKKFLAVFFGGMCAVGTLQMNHAYGSHHLGTTRMSDDPSRGVVDSNCRVHGMSNLYVAGSSVFPTGGFENPTFTILALALRLADYIDHRAATR